jgi:endogenous inhibitor of DNA gyrase (YacG/DUF329 family)
MGQPKSNEGSYHTQPCAKRIVTCPACGGDSVFGPANAARPFCSTRCKNIDLGAWASESFRVQTSITPDDLQFGDPKLQ